tara:strand:- start:1448 stop:1714 length:267 start_codon:yes stop_codon:yes gene_type:complete
MHVNRTFSLKLSTVNNLNDTIQAKNRSKFVDRAISERLDPTKYDARGVSSRRLLAILIDREEISDFCNRVLVTEFNDLERKMKKELNE